MKTKIEYEKTDDGRRIPIALVTVDDQGKESKQVYTQPALQPKRRNNKQIADQELLADKQIKE